MLNYERSPSYEATEETRDRTSPETILKRGRANPLLARMLRLQFWRRGGERTVDHGNGDEDLCDSLEGTHFYEMCMIRPSL